jgi:hypothetical protein
LTTINCDCPLNIEQYYQGLSDKELKVSSSLKMKYEIKGSILGIGSFASFFRVIFYLLHMYFFNLTNPDYLPLIIIPSKVRISLTHPTEGNSSKQLK